MRRAGNENKNISKIVHKYYIVTCYLHPLNEVNRRMSGSLLAFVTSSIWHQHSVLYSCFGNIMDNLKIRNWFHATQYRSRSVGQEITCLLWKVKVRYRIHNSPPDEFSPIENYVNESFSRNNHFRIVSFWVMTFCSLACEYHLPNYMAS
jgi:hypothetical protein